MPSQPHRTRIRVTQEHINLGIKDSCVLCPVARALNEVLSDEYYADVLSTSMRICRVLDEPGVYAAERYFPSHVTERIQQYDQTGEMEPFVFELDLQGYLQ